jgi:hypothetical protein
MKYFKLPPALAFVARAITQMEGVGVMLDEDAYFLPWKDAGKPWIKHGKLCFI